MMALTRVFASLLALLPAFAVHAATFEELAARANGAREANKISDAIGLYQQALQLKPDWAEGLWFLGTLAYDTDQYEIGRRAFSEFVKLQENAGGGWSFLGLCEFETGDYPHALEHIQRGLKMATGLDPSIDQVLRFHEAMLLTRMGLFDQAMPRYMPLVQRRIQNPVLTLAVGLTSLHQPLLPKDLPMEKQDLVAAVGNAARLWMLGDTAKTGPAFQALLKSYPNAPGVHYFYASYLLSFRPAEEAMVELKRELELNPHNPDARATIALLMVRAGASNAALPLARQAAEDGPTCPMAQFTYGLILGENAELQQAIQRLETAERLDPANLEYHMGLAGLYSKAGRHEDARRERRISIQMAKESGAHGQG